MDVTLLYGVIKSSIVIEKTQEKAQEKYASTLRRTHVHGPLARTGTRLETMELRAPQQTIHATDPIVRRRAMRHASRDACGARSGDDSDTLGGHASDLVRADELVQVRDERVEHVAAAHARRVLRIYGPPPPCVLPNRPNPQRAARWPRCGLRVVRRGHRQSRPASRRGREEDRARAGAQVPCDRGKADRPVGQ